MKRFLLLSLPFALAACGSRDDAARGADRPHLQVTTAVVRTEPLADSFEVGGSVRSRTVAVLSSRIVAPVVEVRVKGGDRVRAGQAVVTLDDRELRASALRADAALAGARQNALAAAADERAAASAVSLAAATHKRMSGLRARNSATPAEFDEAVAGLEAAQARAGGSSARAIESQRAIEAAQASARAAAVAQSYATISVPFDGIVTARSVDPGNLASPGVPLLTIEDPHHFRMEVTVDASRAAAVAPGAAVPVTIDGVDGMLDGVVAEISQSVDPITHMFTVKIDLPSAPRLRSGLYGHARLAGATAQVQSVPATAVVRRGQLAMVFVEESGVARMRLVHTGPESGGRVAVLAGLSDGEHVVIDPPAGLVDGTGVTTTRAGRDR
jgi:RND family efflux transporter MFP subunit